MKYIFIFIISKVVRIHLRRIHRFYFCIKSFIHNLKSVHLLLHCQIHHFCRIKTCKMHIDEGNTYVCQYLAIICTTSESTLILRVFKKNDSFFYLYMSFQITRVWQLIWFKIENICQHYVEESVFNVKLFHPTSNSWSRRRQFQIFAVGHNIPKRKIAWCLQMYIAKATETFHFYLTVYSYY